MTFTVILRCPATGALGVCLTTSSLAVASRCPQVDGGIAACSAQANTDWRLSLRALRLLSDSLDPTEAISALAEDDPHHAYRQIGIVDRLGRAAAVSGSQTREYSGHRVGDGYVAMGNGVVSKGVIDAMADACESSPDRLLEDRLVQALEAGWRVGGQRKGHVSAGLIVAAAGESTPRTDLRIDLAGPGSDAVAELRDLYDAYRPLAAYYREYWPDHPTASVQEWRDLQARS